MAFVIGDQIVLHPGDVVYVTTAPIDRWNALISDLLPTLAFERNLRNRFDF